MIKEISFIPATCYANINGKHDFEIAVDILASGKHPYKEIVTHEYSLEDIQEDLRLLMIKLQAQSKFILGSRIFFRNNIY